MKALEILSVLKKAIEESFYNNSGVTFGKNTIFEIEDAIKELEAQIEELQKPKTCEGCKYFRKRFNVRGELAYMICDKGESGCNKDFGCIYHEPK